MVWMTRLFAGLAALGGRRLAALAVAGLTVFALVAVSGYYLSRPAREVLYSNLDTEDVNRIGAALAAAGIAFDVSVKGDAVLVDYGKTATARMILAEQGLPKSDRSGYELFDKMGSLGLTSFMQQVTRVRALEGELARTIQQIAGVKAARVHLALRNEGSFRAAAEQPTASVVLRLDGATAGFRSEAVQHLVAAAVPGLLPNQVTVMTTDGALLAAGGDEAMAQPGQLIGLEHEVAADAEDKISRTLSPYLGVGNFRVSVTARLNTDRREINETAFDPESKVERSTRSVKENNESQNRQSQQAVSVEQNVPQEANPSSGGGDSSSDKKERKEETANYEINSKQTATVSHGYGVDLLSVAVVVNRPVLAKSLGDNAPEDKITARIDELARLARSAIGFSEKRGDTLTVTAVDFIADQAALDAMPEESLMMRLSGHVGSVINAAALIIVSLLVMLLGLKPALKLILAAPPAGAPAPAAVGQLPGLEPGQGAITDATAQELLLLSGKAPQDKLARIVEIDADRAAQVLKQWLRQPDTVG